MGGWMKELLGKAVKQWRGTDGNRNSTPRFIDLPAAFPANHIAKNNETEVSLPAEIYFSAAEI